MTKLRHHGARHRCHGHGHAYMHAWLRVDMLQIRGALAFKMRLCVRTLSYYLELAAVLSRNWPPVHVHVRAADYYFYSRTNSLATSSRTPSCRLFSLTSR